MKIFKTSRGQSIIEYTTVAVLVMIGILVAGPYVIRSINALFKNIDDSSRESLSENLHQAPPVVGKKFPSCDCSEMRPNSSCGGGGCSFAEREWSRSCNPAGCEVDLEDYGFTLKECRFDPDCCAPPVWTGNCGVGSVNVGPPDYCPDGYGEMLLNCQDPVNPGVTRQIYVCSDKPIGSCNFSCSPKHQFAVWCNSQANSRLTGPQFTIHYQAGVPPAEGGCPADCKCCAECRPPTFPTDDGGLGCEACQEGEIFVWNKLCPAGDCDQGTCSTGECLQDDPLVVP